MDPSSFSSVLTFIQHQGYFILFLIMIFEGPLITAAAAFAASLGLFNVYIIFALSFLGNIFGDLTYFFIGKVGRKTIIDRYFKRFGKDRIKNIEANLKKHPGKALTIIKIVPPLPGPGIFSSIFHFSREVELFSQGLLDPVV